jgi:hypothetical protein
MSHSKKRESDTQREIQTQVRTWSLEKKVGTRIKKYLRFLCDRTHILFDEAITKLYSDGSISLSFLSFSPSLIPSLTDSHSLSRTIINIWHLQPLYERGHF